MNRFPPVARRTLPALAALAPMLGVPAFAQPDDAPPTMPTDVRARAYGPTSGGVAWGRSTDDRGVTGYEVSRDGTVLGTFDALSHVDRDLIPGASRRYGITAIDTAGQRSGTAFVALGGAPEAGGDPDAGPAVPAGLRASAYSATAGELFWERAAASGLAYEVRRDGAVAGTTDGTSFFDDGLSGGRTYVYEVVATDAAGARSAPAAITLTARPGASGTDPVDPAEPAPTGLITADGYEAVLREVVALIDRAFPEAVRDALDDLAGDFGPLDRDAVPGTTFVSEEVGESFDGDDGVFDVYACDAGGSVRVLRESGPAVRPDDVRFEACLLADGRRDGRYAFRSRGREGTGSTRVEGLELERADATSLRFDGRRETEADRVGFRRSLAWTDAAWRAGAADGTVVAVDGYRSRLVYRSGADNGFPFGTFGLELPGRGFVPIGESVLDASVSSAFTVTAPWTGGAPLVVTASLSLDEGYASYPGLGDGPQTEAQASVRDDPSIVRTVRLGPPDVVNWTGGSVELVARDGSSLRVDPDSGDPETFLAYLNGSSEPIVRSWSDAGLQVSCGLPGADCD